MDECRSEQMGSIARLRSMQRSRSGLFCHLLRVVPSLIAQTSKVCHLVSLIPALCIRISPARCLGYAGTGMICAALLLHRSATAVKEESGEARASGSYCRPSRCFDRLQAAVSLWLV